MTSWAMDSPRLIRSALAALTITALAACTGDRTALTPATPAGPSAPPVNMAGRWLLMSPGQGQCHMTFGGAAGASEGTVAPEGGCPGQFYTSRKWSFDSTGLTIGDHNGRPLAQLTTTGGPQFTGQSTAGVPVTLAR